MPQVTTGLENLESSGATAIAGMRVGLLTNPCGVDSSLTSSIEIIHNIEVIELVSLFAPEHGIRGEVQAGGKIEAERDITTGIPIHSLYGSSRTPTAEMLADIDALIVDLQDIGVRHTTYISSLDNILSACHEHGKQVVILDRPNPLGGDLVRGGVLQEKFHSFIGTHTIPVIHGMTMGELGLLIASERGFAQPIVVPMTGWSRSMMWDETGLPWVFPSPNLPTLESHVIYPATCLIEGTNLSEGRGTTRPFEIIGAPWIDPFQFSSDIRALNLNGVRVRPLYFVPMISKHTNQRCGGVQVYVERDAATNSIELGVHLLRKLFDRYPDEVHWLEPPKQGSRYFIDLLTGGADVRQTIDSGTDPAKLFERWESKSAAFRIRREPFLLYDSAR